MRLYLNKSEAQLIRLALLEYCNPTMVSYRLALIILDRLNLCELLQESENKCKSKDK